MERKTVRISVHLYGPPLGEVDGRDYDPSCDRLDDAEEEMPVNAIHEWPFHGHRKG